MTRRCVFVCQFQSRPLLSREGRGKRTSARFLAFFSAHLEFDSKGQAGTGITSRRLSLGAEYASQVCRKCVWHNSEAARRQNSKRIDSCTIDVFIRNEWPCQWQEDKRDRRQWFIGDYDKQGQGFLPNISRIKNSCCDNTRRQHCPTKGSLNEEARGHSNLSIQALEIHLLLPWPVLNPPSLQIH